MPEGQGHDRFCGGPSVDWPPSLFRCWAMVRPERRVLLAGESPVRVSAEAPGSRPQPGEETPWVRAGRQRPVLAGSNEAGRNKVNTSASSDCQPKGVWEGRAAHSTAKATDSSLVSERLVDLSGVGVVARFDRRTWNRRDPTRQPASGKDCSYKAGRLKSSRAGRESEGPIVPVKACSKTRRREGALLWSCRWAGKREGMPETANIPLAKARQLLRPAIGARQVARLHDAAGEGSDRRSDAPLKDQPGPRQRRHARRIQKIIVKPYAGKPHVRFERRFLETGQR